MQWRMAYGEICLHLQNSVSVMQESNSRSLKFDGLTLIQSLTYDQLLNYFQAQSVKLKTKSQDPNRIVFFHAPILLIFSAIPHQLSRKYFM